MRRQIAVKEIGDWLWVPIPKEIAEKYRLRQGSVLDLLGDHYGFAIHHYVGRYHPDHPISIAERAAESSVAVKAESERVPEASEHALLSKATVNATIDEGAKPTVAPATPAPKSTPTTDATAIRRCAKLQPNGGSLPLTAKR